MIWKQALIFKASTITLFILAKLALDNTSILYSIGDCHFLSGKARSRSFLKSLFGYIYTSRRSFKQSLHLIYSVLQYPTLSNHPQTVSYVHFANQAQAQNRL